MKNNPIREMAVSGVLITIGLVLPLMFHFFGLGKSFLPMHIPVLLAGFILSMPYAIALAIITPLLSSVITGMPPVFPVLPYMVFELAVYAAVSNALSQKVKLNTYVSLILSMIAGRIAAGIVVWGMVVLFRAKLPDPIIFIISAVLTGIPGIAIQIALIPPMVVLLKKIIIIRNEVYSVE